jgi:hypothetical protein
MGEYVAKKFEEDIERERKRVSLQNLPSISSERRKTVLQIDSDEDEE